MQEYVCIITFVTKAKIKGKNEFCDLTRKAEFSHSDIRENMVQKYVQ